MKKSISKELVLDTALELLKDKSNIHDANLREIARTIGCAHTNLYNYFTSYNDLLWAVHAEVENKAVQHVLCKLSQVENKHKKLRMFFESLSDFYLAHRGWFRLLWLDYVSDIQPEEDRQITEKIVDKMIDILDEIWSGIYCTTTTKEKTHHVLHDVHCYIIGEVSNFINGRGLITDKDMLVQHIADTATLLYTLYLCKET